MLFKYVHDQGFESVQRFFGSGFGSGSRLQKFWIQNPDPDPDFEVDGSGFQIRIRIHSFRLYDNI